MVRVVVRDDGRAQVGGPDLHDVEGVASYAYMGSPTTFRKAGFRDVASRAGSRPIVRYIFAEEGVSRSDR